MAYDTELMEEEGGEPTPAPSALRVSEISVPDSVIEAARKQLAAGQPVTALPKQTWSPEQQQAWNARRNAYDEAVAQRRRAEEEQQLMRYLMLSGMANRTNKAVETALKFQAFRGLENDVRQGIPMHQAIARNPRVFFSSPGGMAGAIRAATPMAEPKVVPPAGGTPGYIQDPRGVPHFFPGSGQSPAHALGQVVPVKDPTTGQDLGHVIATGPNTGRYVKPENLETLNPSQKIARNRAQISAIQAQLNNAYLIKDSKAKVAFVEQKTKELGDVYKDLTDLSSKVVAPANVSIQPTNAPATPAKPAPAAGGLPHVTSKAQRDALPPGTRYVGPDGKQYLKK